MTISYPPEWASLKFPAKRAELIEYLSEIASAEPGSNPSYENFSFDEVVHFFFDDTNLSDQNQDAVGEVIFDDVESKLIQSVTAAIDDVLKQLGDQDSRAYLAHEAWPEIRRRAQAALDAIRLRGLPRIS